MPIIKGSTPVSGGSSGKKATVEEGEEYTGTSSEDEESSDEEHPPSRSQALAEERAHKVRTSFSKPARWMIIIGMILALCAGLVNVTMLLEVETVVSHVTGHLTAVGLRLEGARVGVMYDDWVEPQDTSILTKDSVQQHLDNLSKSCTVIISFMFGSFLCGLVVPHNALRFGGKSFYGVALLGNSCLLLVAFAAMALATPDVTGHRTKNRMVAEGAAAAACGLQNAMCTMHLGAIVRTTHCTGTATDIGSTVGRVCMIFLRKTWKRRLLTIVERAEVDVDLEKMRVLFGVFVSFLVGCIFGAFLYSHIGYFTILVAAGMTLVMGVTYTCFRERLKRRLQRLRVRQLEREMEEVTDMLQTMRSRQEHYHGGSDSEPAGTPAPSSPLAENEEDEDSEVENMLERLHTLQEEVADFYEVHGASPGSHSHHASPSRAARMRTKSSRGRSSTAGSAAA